jgi:hypothetical protein
MIRDRLKIADCRLPIHGLAIGDCRLTDFRVPIEVPIDD